MDSCQNVPEFWHFIKFLQAHKENYDNILELGCFKGGSVRRFIETISDSYAMDGDFDFRIQIDGSKWKGHCGITAFIKGDLDEHKG